MFNILTDTLNKQWPAYQTQVWNCLLIEIYFVLLFCIENLVELLDLPDEMILAIMNK